MADSYETLMTEMGDKVVMGDWHISRDGGVWLSEPQVRKGDVVGYTTKVASPIPILPLSLLYNADSFIEKVEIGVYKSHRWKRIIADRATIANKSAIIKLANDGVEVNTGNASALVKYFGDVIAQSLETLPRKTAKSVMGWIDDDKFMPYTDAAVFDGDDNYGYLYRSIEQAGSLEEWCEFVRPLRKKIEVRLCMAAAFASPLIERVAENPFVLHLWGKTGTAKTVSLMVAMSIWGNPAIGKLTRTMNMTTNSMLSTAAFLRNLPFAGDELQTIKERWGNYDKLIMCITEGIDRGRMTYDKINETKAWKCSFLFSGEEPCIKLESGGGAKNRVIEVELRDKLIECGNETTSFVREHYGTAGPKFIEAVKMYNVASLYRAVFNEILELCDTTDKQAGSMALMLVADRMASALFWPDEQLIGVGDVAMYLASAKDVDIAERAYQFVCDLIVENGSNFMSDAKITWGRMENDAVYFITNVLDRELKSAGFDFAAVRNTWIERGYLLKYRDGRCRWMVRINGMVSSCVKLQMPREV